MKDNEILLSPTIKSSSSSFSVCVSLSSQLCDLSQQQLGHPCPHSLSHIQALSVSHTQPQMLALAHVFFVYPFVRQHPLPVCTAGQSLANKPVQARSALSAPRSGFNWMTGVPLTAAVGVIQTPRRSHRLQQVPPLSIKVNPLSPA